MNQSIEGPGGNDKSHLHDHVLEITDLSERNYLTMKVDGNRLKSSSLVNLMVQSASGIATARTSLI